MKNNVLVTFDSMKDPNCGYFSFGKGLGNAILDCNENRYNLTYYIFKQNSYFFKNRVQFQYFSKFHRLFFSAKNKFDIVHLTDQTCRLRPTSVNAKRILTVHDLNKIHLGYSSKNSIRRYLSRLKCRIDSCDKVVAISNFVASDIIRMFPEAKSKLSVIYNGVDKLISAHDHVPAFFQARDLSSRSDYYQFKKDFIIYPLY